MPSSTSRSTTFCSSSVMARESTLPILSTLPTVASGEPAERVEKLEPRPAKLVLGDGDRRVRVARDPLSVNDLDIGRRTGAEADVRDHDDLLRLVCRCARADQQALPACHRLAGGANL